MIEITIWWGNVSGNGFDAYLVDVPANSPDYSDYFKAAPAVAAVRRALAEFEKERASCRIQKIDIRSITDTVLQP